MLSKLLEKFESEGIKVIGKDRLLSSLEGHSDWRDLFLGFVRQRRKYGIVFTPGVGMQNPVEVVEKAMKAYGFSELNIRAFRANASIN